ncbi:MAG: glutamate-1-semialdehyde 2,1-aminomutase [Dehalococcoidia bacterium]|nr:glutamate-1-semialdehyde 2,1-aminomutase [Dehalococcoidia bacterium]
MKRKVSKKLFSEARVFLPGGVDSPVRAFQAVGGSPPFIQRGAGPRLYDEDGNEFLDYVCSWGALILGHAHPWVVAAVQDAAARGTSFGAPTALETELARHINQAMPSLEMLRFVNSGTEATMSALRVARAFTGRDMVLKFAGGYHGHSDGLLAKAGSGSLTLGLPVCPGVPLAYARTTLVAPYNDLAAVERLFHKYSGKIAAIIIEPVAANMGVVPPRPGFLKGLRQLTRKAGSLLIFDEVITGFRVAYGGAQALYEIVPDLTCLGKIIGGGLPIGAYGGRRDIMSLVAPMGPVYQAGTLSGNPLSMTAGIQTLKMLEEPVPYQALEERGALLAEGLSRAARKAKVPLRVSRVGSLLTPFFSEQPVTDYDSARRADTRRYAAFFQGMLSKGIYLPPSQFEAFFISLAHRDEDIERTVQAAEEVFKRIS